MGPQNTDYFDNFLIKVLHNILLSVLLLIIFCCNNFSRNVHAVSKCSGEEDFLIAENIFRISGFNKWTFNRWTSTNNHRAENPFRSFSDLNDISN